MNWLLIFLGFSALIILHEAGHFVVAKATGMRVERFFLFFPPKLVSVKRGETEYGIGAIPLGGFVKISGMNPDEELPPEARGRGYYDQPVWKRIATIAAGPAVNIFLAFAILFLVFWSFDSQRPTQTVGEISAATPAAAALQPGDRILAVDGKAFPGLDEAERREQFALAVASHECAGKPTDGCAAATPVTLRIERRGEPRTITLRPEYDAALKRTRLGFSYGYDSVDLGAGGAAGEALDAMWRVTSGTVDVFANILDPERREEISGVVGISDTANTTLDLFGAREALLLLALVSLSLGLINLFPFLPLDGGHIFWSLVEKVRGERVPFAVMERAGAIGFVLVIMLFFIGLSNDVDRLSSGGFDGR